MSMGINENRLQRAIRLIAQAEGIMVENQIEDEARWQRLKLVAQSLKPHELESLIDLRSRARVLVFWHPSGGVGKTTTTINVAYNLAAAGHRVLVIDVDATGELSKRLAILPDDPPLARCLEQGNDKEVPTAVRLHWKKHNVRQDFWPVTEPGMYNVDRHLQANVGDRNAVLRDLIDKVAEDYDYIMIDPPPGMNILSINALAAATGVLGGLVVPVAAEVKSYDALPNMVNSLARLRSNMPLLLGIVATKVLNNFRAKDTAAGLAQYFAGLAFDTSIPHRTDVGEEPVEHAPVSYYKPSSAAAGAYQQVTLEIEARSTILGYLESRVRTQVLIERYKDVPFSYGAAPNQEVHERG